MRDDRVIVKGGEETEGAMRYMRESTPGRKRDGDEGGEERREV